MNQCASCASFNDPGAVFCSQCGSPLAEGGRPRRRRRRRHALFWSTLVSLLLACSAVAYIGFFSPENEPRKEVRKAPRRRPLPAPTLPSTARPPREAAETDPAAELHLAEAAPEPLSPQELHRRVEEVLVVLRPTDEQGRPLAESRGVLVDPEGIVLARLEPLLGAYGGSCRLGPGARLVPIEGVIHYDVLRDLALVRVRPSGETPFLPLLEEPQEALAPGETVYVLSGERLRASTIEERYFTALGGLSGIRLAEEPPLLADSFLAVDAYGALIGLCRPLAEGAEPVPAIGYAEHLRGRPYRILVVPAQAVAPYLGGGILLSLSELTARLYEGTFADLERRARDAYLRKAWTEAIELLAAAIERGAQEGIGPERLETLERLLREAYLKEIAALEAQGRFEEAEALLTAAVERYPADTSLWRKLGTVRLELGRTQDAVAAFLELRALDPSRPNEERLEDAYLRWAAETLQNGNDRLAETIYLEALGQLPDSGRLHLALARLYREWQAYDDALRLLERARSLSPSLASEIDLVAESIEDVLKRRDAVVIPLPPGSRSIRAKVVVDGKAEFPVIIDTGATYTALPASFVAGLGYEVDRGDLVQVSTAGGTLLVRLVEVQSVSLEGYTVRNLKVLALPDATGPRVGLLGLNFLRFFKYTVDHRRNEFRLERK